jgi:hypothetical protein
MKYLTVILISSPLADEGFLLLFLIGYAGAVMAQFLLELEMLLAYRGFAGRTSVCPDPPVCEPYPLVAYVADRHDLNLSSFA